MLKFQKILHPLRLSQIFSSLLPPVPFWTPTPPVAFHTLQKNQNEVDCVPLKFPSQSSPWFKTMKKQKLCRDSEFSLVDKEEKCEFFIFLSHKLTPRFLISSANEYIVYLFTLKLHQPHLNSKLLILDIWLWASQAIFSSLSGVISSCYPGILRGLHGKYRKRFCWKWHTVRLQQELVPLEQGSLLVTAGTGTVIIIMRINFNTHLFGHIRQVQKCVQRDYSTFTFDLELYNVHAVNNLKMFNIHIPEKKKHGENRF